MLHDMLLSCYDFVEVQASLEFKVISYGTPRASLHVGLRFDCIVRLGTQAILFQICLVCGESRMDWMRMIYRKDFNTMYGQDIACGSMQVYCYLEVS